MQRATKDHINIRDSIHGSIVLNSRELELLDHPALQRLRFIRQAGFIDLAFPGANHTRYAHSLGAMHMATRIFDRLFDNDEHLNAQTRALFRQSLRLASLCHDIGHGPYSHSSEALMPRVSALTLPKDIKSEVERQATHEDYSLKLLIDSTFSQELRRLFSHLGLTPRHIVDLIFRELDSSLFIYEGINYRPVLQQIVSSECDADRMDYLQRDSIYCGVNYGKFDADWLVQNLCPVHQGDAFYLGMRSRAIFSFEDFLLSRYHMFASVYYHHTPVIFDKMLELHCRESEERFQLPADIEAYIRIDDIELWSHLRKSTCHWAKRIVERRPFYLLDEYKIDSESVLPRHSDHEAMVQRLRDEGIQTIRSCSKSLLSKYFGRESSSIFVVTNNDKIIPLESYTSLYQRYLVPAELHRLFVDPAHKEKAQHLLKDLSRE